MRKVRHRETERSVHCHKAIYWWGLDLDPVRLRDYTLNLYTRLSLSLLSMYLHPFPHEFLEDQNYFL